MGKIKFRLIQNPMESDRFSLSATYACAIILFSLGIAVSVFMFFASINIFIIICVIAFFGFTGFFYLKNGNEIRRIIKCGEKIKCEIISYYRYYRHIGTGIRTYTPNFTYLIVRINHKGTHYCKVDIGHVLPSKKLGSTECNAYIYKDTIFITDFIRRKKGEPSINISEINKEQFDKYNFL